MKKFLPKLGGHRVYLDDFRLMQDSYIECLAAIAGMFTNNTNSPFVMSGCERLAGFNVGGIQHYPYNPGYVFFNGEIFNFEGTADIEGSNLSNHFLKINETILPPSPVEYKDQSNKDAHYSRTLIIKNYNSGDGDLDNVNGFYYRNMVRPKLEPHGIVSEWYPMYAGEENDVFDSDGLGIGRMYGYAICNGKFSTPDLRGLFTVMPSVNMKTSATLLSPAIPGLVVKNKYGTRFNVFTIAKENLPNYNLPITQQPHSHTYQAYFPTSVGAGDWGDDSSDMSSQLKTTNPTSIDITVNSGGSGTAMSIENVPPTYGMIKVMKLNV